MKSLPILLLALLTGCASYQSKVSVSRALLESGNAVEAAEKLRPLAETVDGDQLVYLLDYGTALQAAGRYSESTKIFLKADRLSEELDYHSVSRVTGSLLLNEEMKQYKGDTFEKIFINAQLALNFLAVGNLDSALVEARRINQKFQKLRADDTKKFEMNPLAKYLSALIWEADRKFDDAYIDYAETYKISPEIEGLREDLIRVAKLSKRDDAYAKWKRSFPEVREKPEWYDKSLGELIVIAQVGWGPRKTYSRHDDTWPVLMSTPSVTRSVRARTENRMEESRFIYDVEAAAIATLEDDRLSLLGRRLTGVVAKEVAADQIRQKNELLGAIAWMALHASDRADLRQWSTLPRNVQIIRMKLKPGTYSLNLEGVDLDGVPTADHLEQSVEIKSGRKSFVIWRTFR